MPLFLALAYAVLAALGNFSGMKNLVSHVSILIGHVLLSFPPYALSIPCYVGLMHLYATARLHDLSWGTRETSSGEALSSRKEAVENARRRRGSPPRRASGRSRMPSSTRVEGGPRRSPSRSGETSYFTTASC